jgi:hypothetical protein
MKIEMIVCVTINSIKHPDINVIVEEDNQSLYGVLLTECMGL